MADGGDPAVVYVLSGKRKSGKDFVASGLLKTFGEDVCGVIRLSGPLKYEYARIHGLRFDQLLDSSPYKEKYRVDMIRWGEEKRSADPHYFCRLATQPPYQGQEHSRSNSGKPRSVWIVSDARRLTDLAYFKERYNVISVRVHASEAVRAARGWVFTPGVDDAESECGLDSAVFDVHVQNDGDDGTFRQSIEALVRKGSVFLRQPFGSAEKSD